MAARASSLEDSKWSKNDLIMIFTFAKILDDKFFIEMFHVLVWSNNNCKHIVIDVMCHLRDWNYFSKLCHSMIFGSRIKIIPNINFSCISETVYLPADRPRRLTLPPSISVSSETDLLSDVDALSSAISHSSSVMVTNTRLLWLSPENNWLLVSHTGPSGRVIADRPTRVFLVLKN